MSMIETIPGLTSDAWKIFSRWSVSLSVLLLGACAVQPPLPSEPVRADEAAPAAVTDVAEQAVQEEAAVPVTPDRITTLQRWVDQHNRLYAIAAPLLIENTELCPRHARDLLGFTAKSRFSYSGRFGEVARAALGLGDRLRVMNVLPGSGAAKAGLKKGDTLIAIDGKPVPQSARPERDTAMMVAAAMRGRDSLMLTVLRDGQRETLRIPFTRACAFGIELGNGDHVNSYADGYRVLITRGMLNFARSDEELAYALAKEIAHNIVAPTPRPDLGAVIDKLRQVNIEPVAGATGLAPYSPVLDATADKLALYLLVRAGYPIEQAVPFWQRLASRYPEGIAEGYTALHPATSYRVSVMSEVVKTIKSKQAHKQALLP